MEGGQCSLTGRGHLILTIIGPLCVSIAFGMSTENNHREDEVII
jgi:hypothetical protein